MPKVKSLITDNLDIWTSTIQKKTSAGRGASKKLNLYGIKKLRELILELAVRGQLVPQNPKDEAASVLLEKIAKEKAQLIKEGKIKKQKALPVIADDEKPFDLPKGWQWVRLGEATNYGVTDKAEAHDVDAESWILELEDVEKETSQLLRKTRFKEKQFKSSKNRFFAGDVIYGKLRPYLDKVIVADEDGVCTTEMIPVRAYCGVSPAFLRLLMKAPYFIRYANSSTHGMNLPRLGTDKARLAFLPLVPESEQHRIVVKVDELMGLCDELEQETEDSLVAHQTLVETLLATLTDSKNAKALAQNWDRVAEHFDMLFTTENSINQLKQTILQLAVMGKLVPQNPKDEPASVLLEKIAKEKVQLIKEGKIKKQKEFVFFEGLEALKKTLPAFWAWVRLNDIADIVRGGSPRPAGDPKFYGGDIPFLKVGDITGNLGKFVEGYNATIKEAGLKKTRYINQRTVLLSNSGATLGIPAICKFPATFNDGVAAFIKQSEYIFDEYLYLYLKTLSRWFLDIASQGQGQPNLNTDIIKATWFSLPPFKEQHRIVAKVDELMALCDQLQADFGETQSLQLHLADALVEQAVA
jgi:type I restriction enzyme, S subunit